MPLPTLEEYKQFRPDDKRDDSLILNDLINNALDQGTLNEFPDLQNEYELQESRKRPLFDEVIAGLLSGTDQAQAQLYSSAGILGELLDRPDLQQWAFDGYQRNIQEAGENAPSISRLEDARRPFDYLLWGIGTASTQAPQLGFTIAGALGGRAIGTGLGALVGSLGGPPGTVAGAALGGTIGQLFGGFGTAFAQTQNWADLVESNPESEDRLATALAVGSVGAGLELLLPTKILSRYFKGASRGTPAKYVSRVLVAVPEAAAIEGSTEVLQELAAIAGEAYVNRENPQYVIDKKEVMSRLTNAFAGGALVGAGVGGVAEVGTRFIPESQEPRTEQQQAEEILSRAQPVADILNQIDREEVISAVPEQETAGVVGDQQTEGVPEVQEGAREQDRAQEEKVAPVTFLKRSPEQPQSVQVMIRNQLTQMRESGQLTPEKEAAFLSMLGGEDVFNLTEGIPGHPAGSTIGRAALEASGYTIPDDAVPAPEPVSDVATEIQEPTQTTENLEAQALQQMKQGNVQEAARLGLQAENQFVREILESQPELPEAQAREQASKSSKLRQQFDNLRLMDLAPEWLTELGSSAAEKLLSAAKRRAYEETSIQPPANSIPALDAQPNSFRDDWDEQAVDILARHTGISKSQNLSSGFTRNGIVLEDVQNGRVALFGTFVTNDRVQLHQGRANKVITPADIAKALETTPATVRRALTDSSYTSKKARSIRTYAELIGYRPKDAPIYLREVLNQKTDDGLPRYKVVEFLSFLKPNDNVYSQFDSLSEYYQQRGLAIAQFTTASIAAAGALEVGMENKAMLDKADSLAKSNLISKFITALGQAVATAGEYTIGEGVVKDTIQGGTFGVNESITGLLKGFNTTKSLRRALDKNTDPFSFLSKANGKFWGLFSRPQLLQVLGRFKDVATISPQQAEQAISEFIESRSGQHTFNSWASAVAMRGRSREMGRTVSLSEEYDENNPDVASVADATQDVREEALRNIFGNIDGEASPESHSTPDYSDPNAVEDETTPKSTRALNLKDIERTALKMWITARDQTSGGVILPVFARQRARNITGETFSEPGFTEDFRSVRTDLQQWVGDVMARRTRTPDWVNQNVNEAFLRSLFIEASNILSPDVRFSTPKSRAYYRASQSLVSRKFGQVLNTLASAGIDIQLFQQNLDAPIQFLQQQWGAFLNHANGRRVIALTLADVTNPTSENMRLLLHEAAHVFIQQMPQWQQREVYRAIERYSAGQEHVFRQSADPRVAPGNPANLSPDVYLEEVLAEYLAFSAMEQQEAKSLIQNLLQLIRDAINAVLDFIGLSLQIPVSPAERVRALRVAFDAFVSGNVTSLESPLELIGGSEKNLQTKIKYVKAVKDGLQIQTYDPVRGEIVYNDIVPEDSFSVEQTILSIRAQEGLPVIETKVPDFNRDVPRVSQPPDLSWDDLSGLEQRAANLEQTKRLASEFGFQMEQAVLADNAYRMVAAKTEDPTARALLLEISKYLKSMPWGTGFVITEDATKLSRSPNAFGAFRFGHTLGSDGNFDVQKSGPVIFINPYQSWSKNKFIRIILHEGIHAIAIDKSRLLQSLYRIKFAPEGVIRQIGSLDHLENEYSNILKNRYFRDAPVDKMLDEWGAIADDFIAIDMAFDQLGVDKPYAISAFDEYLAELPTSVGARNEIRDVMIRSHQAAGLSVQEATQAADHFMSGAIQRTVNFLFSGPMKGKETLFENVFGSRLAEPNQTKNLFSPQRMRASSIASLPTYFSDSRYPAELGVEGPLIRFSEPPFFNPNNRYIIKKVEQPSLAFIQSSYGLLMDRLKGRISTEDVTHPEDSNFIILPAGQQWNEEALELALESGIKEFNSLGGLVVFERVLGPDRMAKLLRGGGFALWDNKLNAELYFYADFNDFRVRTAISRLNYADKEGLKTYINGAGFVYFSNTSGLSDFKYSKPVSEVTEEPAPPANVKFQYEYGVTSMALNEMLNFINSIKGEQAQGYDFVVKDLGVGATMFRAYEKLANALQEEQLRFEREGLPFDAQGILSMALTDAQNNIQRIRAATKYYKLLEGFQNRILKKRESQTKLVEPLQKKLTVVNDRMTKFERALTDTVEQNNLIAERLRETINSIRRQLQAGQVPGEGDVVETSAIRQLLRGPFSAERTVTLVDKILRQTEANDFKMIDALTAIAKVPNLDITRDSPADIVTKTIEKAQLEKDQRTLSLFNVEDDENRVRLDLAIHLAKQDPSFVTLLELKTLPASETKTQLMEAARMMAKTIRSNINADISTLRDIFSNRISNMRLYDKVQFMFDQARKESDKISRILRTIEERKPRWDRALRETQNRMSPLEEELGITGRPFEFFHGATALVPGEKNVELNMKDQDGFPKQVSQILMKNAKWLREYTGPKDRFYNSIVEQQHKLAYGLANNFKRRVGAHFSDEYLKSIPNRLRKIGTGQARRSAARWDDYQQKIFNQRAQVQRLGRRVNETLGLAMKKFNLSYERFLQRLVAPSYRFIDTSPELVTGDTSEQRVRNALFAYLRRTPLTSSYITTSDQFETLWAFLKANTDANKYTVRLNEEWGSRVYDESIFVKSFRTGERQRGFRIAQDQGLFTVQRTAEQLGSIEAAMKPTWEKIEIGQDTTPDQIRSLFNPEILELFLKPFIYDPNLAHFPSVPRENAVSDTLRALPENVVAAWEQTANEDVYEFLTNLYVLESGQDASTVDPAAAHAFALRSMSVLKGKYNKIRAILNETDNRLDKWISMLPHQIMDARKANDFPAEMLSYQIYDESSLGISVAQLAAHAAFGRDLGHFGNGDQGNDGIIWEMRHMRDELQERIAEAVRIRNRIARQNPRLSDREVRKLLRNEMGKEAFDAYEDAVKQMRILPELERDTLAFFQSQASPTRENRLPLEFIRTLAGLMVNNIKTTVLTGLQIFDPIILMGLNRTSITRILRTIGGILQAGTGTLMQAMGMQLETGSRWAKLMAEADTLQDPRNNIKGVMYDKGLAGRYTRGTANRILGLMRRARTVALNTGVSFVPEEHQIYPRLKPLGIFPMGTMITNHGTVVGALHTYETLIKRAMESLGGDMSPLSNPDFKFTAEDVGYTGGNKRAYEEMVESLARMGTTLEKAVVDALEMRNQGETRTLLTPDMIRRISAMTVSEISLENNPTITPVGAYSNSVLRLAAPLLTWGWNRMSQFGKGFRNPQGESSLATIRSGLFMLAFGLIPIGLAYSLLLDELDETLFNKKTNLMPIGPQYDAQTNVLGSMERLARVGTFGLAGDVANGLFVYGSEGDLRGVSIDQRVLFTNAIINMLGLFNTLYRQEGQVTYQSIMRPLLQGMGGTGAIQTMQLMNTVSDSLMGHPIFRKEAEVTARISALNYLRSSGRILDYDVRTGFGPRALSNAVKPHVSNMLLSAISNDPIGFQESYRRALAAAKREGREDPEEYVKRSFSSYHPLRYIFRTPPSENEYRALLYTLDSEGKASVQGAINNFNTYNEALGNRAYFGKAEKREDESNLFDITSNLGYTTDLLREQQKAFDNLFPKVLDF